MKFAGFTPDQQYALLTKMGYKGPKNEKSMGEFLSSNPKAVSQLADFTQRAQDKLSGKTPQGMAEGGMVTATSTPSPEQTDLDAAQKAYAELQKKAVANPEDQATLSALEKAQQTLTASQSAFKTTAVDSGAEQVAKATQNPMDLITKATAEKVEQNPDQFVDPNAGQAEDTGEAETKTVTDTAQAQAPEKTDAAKVDPTLVQGEVSEALEGVEAAQAEPSKDATVRGQLESLMADFEKDGTPPWASGAMRSAMAAMQARGLGASSMAGSAIVQAAMESAIGIASQDAATQAQFEMQNLNNEQQMTIFKTQQRIAGLFSDQAAENAAKQFNAASDNQTNQFFAGLQESVARFNADQVNAIRQFNAGEENATSKFNEQLQSQRAQFNAQNSLIVAQANAKWRQDIATMDTAAQNEANMLNAKNATGMTTLAMDEVWQKERDLMAYAFTASESAKDRDLEVFLGEKKIQQYEKDRKASEDAAKGSLITQVLMGMF